MGTENSRGHLVRFLFLSINVRPRLPRGTALVAPGLSTSVSCMFDKSVSPGARTGVDMQ